MTFLPVSGNLNKIKLGPETFQIRLDHLLHFFVYFLICIYYLFGILKDIKLFEKNSLSKFVLLTLLLAVVTEVIQLWIPERTFNVYDLVANVVGLLIGLGLIEIAGGKLKVIVIW